MHKIVCQGCGDIFMSNTQEENNKWMKLHWDYQYPSHAKCEFCDTIFHDNDDDSVKKKLFEHEEKSNMSYLTFLAPSPISDGA